MYEMKATICKLSCLEPFVWFKKILTFSEYSQEIMHSTVYSMHSTVYSILYFIVIFAVILQRNVDGLIM